MLRNIILVRLTLAIDAMGGDYGPCITVPASLDILSSHLQLNLILIGNVDIISHFTEKVDHSILSRLQVIPTHSIIASDDKPSKAIRNSFGTSMRVGLELLQLGKVQACISAGNTGTLMGLSKILLKPIKGIKRPALMSMLPHHKKGKTVILDIGANADANSKMLVQFAIMGAIVAEVVLGITYPRIALLNIGQEYSKGLETIRSAACMFKDLNYINYIGYIEGNDLLIGKADVIVCNGFTGNITIKTMEGVVKMLLSSLQNTKKRKTMISLLRHISYQHWVKKFLSSNFNYLNPEYYNGAFLLGLRGTVIKSHGCANKNAFSIAIENAMQAVNHKLADKVADRIAAILANNSEH